MYKLKDDQLTLNAYGVHHIVTNALIKRKWDMCYRIRLYKKGLSYENPVNDVLLELAKVIYLRGIREATARGVIPVGFNPCDIIF